MFQVYYIDLEKYFIYFRFIFQKLCQTYMHGKFNFLMFNICLISSLNCECFRQITVILLFKCRQQFITIINYITSIYELRYVSLFKDPYSLLAFFEFSLLSVRSPKVSHFLFFCVFIFVHPVGINLATKQKRTAF